MNRTRPTVVLVFAVLNIVFGSLALLIVSCGAVFQLIVNRLAVSGAATSGALKDLVESSQKVQEAMQLEVPGYTLITRVGLVMAFALTIAMIVGGIGLLRMKPWGRRLTIVWAGTLVLYQIAQTIYQVALVLPVQLRLQQEIMAKQAGQGPDLSVGSSFVVVFAILFALLLISYAVSFLVVMLLPTVSAAFAGKALPAGGEPEDYYDERATRGGNENG
jgi:hypothetical protein